MRRHRTIAVLTGVLALAGTLTAAPASASIEPDLQVTATAAPGPYVVGEEFKVSVTVTNIGGGVATGIKGSISTSSGSYPSMQFEDWGEFNPVNSGGTLDPGKSKTFVVRTKFYNWNGTPAPYASVQETSRDADYTNNQASFGLQLISPEVKDTVGGTIYADANGDGKQQPGEALSGVKVTLGWNPPIVATTDADGKFTLTGVPAGMYTLSQFEAPGGWRIPYGAELRVDGNGGNQGLVIRAVRPLDETLHATITLDKDTYPNSGAKAVVTVKLQNTGTRAISGIHVGCDPVGSSDDLKPPLQNWGALAYNAAGATVPANSTSTFTVVGYVSMRSAAIGRTHIDCYFHTDYSSGDPYSSDQATVPGKKGPVTGKTWQDKNSNGTLDAGEAVGGVKAELTQDGSTVKYTATSAADGTISFGDVPVGYYHFKTLAPWQDEWDQLGAWAVPFNQSYNFVVQPAA